MKYKDDWSDAKARLTALWNDDALERPCIGVTAPNGKNVAAPPLPSDPEDRWLDPEYVVPAALAELENTWWGGESVPSVLLNAGWVVSLGGKPRFSFDTIWFDTVDVDFTGPSPFVYDPDSPWTEKHRTLYAAMAKAAGRDDFLVGQPCFLPANDLLSMHMGVSTFLTSLVDHPEWMREAIIEGARGIAAARKEHRDLISKDHEFWYGNAGWMRFWVPEEYFVTQSDVSCMLSPQMYDQFIVPELEIFADEFGPLWYHLDGANARQHLPRLLSVPYLRVVQYTPASFEPLNGPEHLDMYKQIQAAGKIVYIEAPKENVEAIVRELGSSRLFILTQCESMEEGKALLESAKTWAGSAPAT